VLYDFDRELTGQSFKKIRENILANYSIAYILDEIPFVFADGRTQVIVRLELEYNQILPIVEVVTTKMKNERKADVIKHYIQVIGHAVWEEYQKMEETK
jgi:hypothetical protein